MPLPRDDFYTSEDYWNLPDDIRSDLIYGTLHIRKTPYRIHQQLLGAIYCIISDYLKNFCPEYDLIMGPFGVNPDGDNQNWVEPDCSVVCAGDKLNDRCCIGAPDWIIEIVSFDTRKTDYIEKTYLYAQSGVREYWIIDPEKQQTTVYHFEKDYSPMFYPFDQSVSVGIFEELNIVISDLLNK